MAKYSLTNFLTNEALALENASLKIDRDKLKATVSELSQTSAALKTVKAELAKVQSEHSTALETLKTDYQTKVETLTKELEATKIPIAEKVIKGMAAEMTSVGIQAGTVKEESQTAVTLGSALETLHNLKGEKAQDFYNKNKSLFLGHIKNPQDNK